MSFDLDKKPQNEVFNPFMKAYNVHKSKRLDLIDKGIKLRQEYMEQIGKLSIEVRKISHALEQMADNVDVARENSADAEAYVQEQKVKCNIDNNA